MIKTITTLICLVFFSSFSQSQEKNLIGFEGLYETKCEYEEGDDEGTQSYLRFYPNGNVISVSTDCDGTADDLKDWFNTEMEYLSIGKYKIKGRKIRFSTTSSSVGTVKYRGRIAENGLLELKSKSMINGYKGYAEYLFVKVSKLK